jgi:hypothetical protein
MSKKTAILISIFSLAICAAAHAQSVAIDSSTDSSTPAINTNSYSNERPFSTLTYTPPSISIDPTSFPLGSIGSANVTIAENNRGGVYNLTLLFDGSGNYAANDGNNGSLHDGTYALNSLYTSYGFENGSYTLIEIDYGTSPYGSVAEVLADCGTVSACETNAAPYVASVDFIIASTPPPPSPAIASYDSVNISYAYLMLSLSVFGLYVIIKLISLLISSWN